MALHRSDYGPAIADDYAERLSLATGFRYPPEEYIRDVDPGFYSARYLRAWQLEATLASELVEEHDEDWYRNPRAGGFVHDLMTRGQAEPADAVARSIGRPGLSFQPAIARLAALLG
jgi:hypothetical protein